MEKYTIRGGSGHPSHPPLAGTVVALYLLGSIAAVVGAFGAEEVAMSYVAPIAIGAGLLVAIGAITTGFLDWLRLEHGSLARRRATVHWVAVAIANVFELIALLLLWSGYGDGEFSAAGVVFAALGLIAISIGGWIGGSLVFEHGIRVQGRVPLDDAPAESTRPERLDDRRRAT